MVIFGMLILIFFAIIGLCAFISSLLDIFYNNKSEALIILRDLSADNAEARVRSAARLCLRKPSMRLLCVCDEENPAYDICLLLKKEYPFLEIISSEGLGQL